MWRSSTTEPRQSRSHTSCCYPQKLAQSTAKPVGPGTTKSERTRRSNGSHRSGAHLAEVLLLFSTKEHWRSNLSASTRATRTEDGWILSAHQTPTVVTHNHDKTHMTNSDSQSWSTFFYVGWLYEKWGLLFYLGWLYKKWGSLHFLIHSNIMRCLPMLQRNVWCEEFVSYRILDH